jgi:hypothetical protein
VDVSGGRHANAVDDHRDANLGGAAEVDRGGSEPVGVSGGDLVTADQNGVEVDALGPGLGWAGC